MRFKELSQSDKDAIIRAYELYDKKGDRRADLQNQLADTYNVTPRAIRKWAKRQEVGMMAKNIVNPYKVMRS